MSVYLPNVYRLAFNCDSVVPESVAKAKATAYCDRTGKTIYVPGLGEVSPTPAPPDGDGNGDGSAYGTPVPDMINSFNKKQLQELVEKSSWADAFDKEIFKSPIATVRQAVLEAYRLATGA